MTYGVKSGADLRDLINGIVLTSLLFIISIVLIVYIKIDVCTQENKLVYSESAYSVKHFPVSLQQSVQN